MSHFITLADAREMTARFKSNMENILDSSYRNKKILANCETFDRDAIDKILAQTECTQFRIYYGMDTDMKVHAILVGVDATGEHLIPATADAANEQIAEMSQRCPETCPTNLL